MSSRKSEEKRIIIDKLVNSGINVTPSILDFILNLDSPLEKVNLLIKETSFIPTFNSHITEHTLKEIQNKELLNALKRILIKENPISTAISKHSTQDVKSESDNYFKNSPVIKTSIKPKVKDAKPLLKTEKSHKVYNKKEGKIKPLESIKSAFAFKPTAKDYNTEYEIIKDPTGKLYTNGDYNDFYELTLNKFNKLRTLMRKRSEVHSANNINNIYRLSHSVEVSVIGMVNEIRQTKKGNYFLTLEDLTGLINVLVRSDSENLDNRKIAERTIDDQMVYIEGTYNPGERGKKGIIYANYISKIDIPTDYKISKSPDPLSIALISDTHIGSKEFEEKLWNRFMDFLNGKSKNKRLREIAGRIKYIVINGDLVDGIGVYPTQQEDLVISDIYQQYKKASELISQIPDYIKVFYSSGNHEPVRNALPRPAVPKKYAKELINLGVKCIGNPSLIQTHNVNTLVFHGDSILDMNMLIAGLENNKPVETMKELLICRHLAPTYGKKTQIAPTNNDWLVIDKIPDIFHTGHVHINGIGKYRNVSLVNSGCMQNQTEFMKSFGIQPTPGIVPIIELDTFKSLELDFKKIKFFKY